MLIRDWIALASFILTGLVVAAGYFKVIPILEERMANLITSVNAFREEFHAFRADIFGPSGLSNRVDRIQDRLTRIEASCEYHRREKDR